MPLISKRKDIEEIQNLEGRYWGCYQENMPDTPLATFMFESDAVEWAEKSKNQIVIKPVKISF